MVNFSFTKLVFKKLDEINSYRYIVYCKAIKEKLYEAVYSRDLNGFLKKFGQSIL